MAGIKSLQSLKQKACLTTVNSSQGAQGLEATMSCQDVKLANEVTLITYSLLNWELETFVSFKSL